MTQPKWRPLNVGIIGGGLGGLASATALRRQGHIVTIYERADFAGEVGASISCAANGTRWLEEWGVNIEMGDPVVIRQLISRDWKTGEPVSVYDLANYKEKWGYVSQRFTKRVPEAILRMLGILHVPPAIHACHAHG
jgi:salicylate hydroxylase